MTEEKAVVLTEERAMVPFGTSIFLDMARFEAAQRVGTLLASSTMVPKQFENNVANCVIALNLAERLRVDPFMMMQSMYVVHGRPGIEAKLAIALIEGTGRFTPLQYRLEGMGKTKKDVERPDSCVAWAKDLKTGELIEGPKVTWAMAEAERWTQDKGTETSKWQTIPDLMFRYRAAMFFARVNCPGALLGLRSSEELEDMQMIDVTPERPAGLKGNGEEKAAAIEKFTASIPPGAPHLDEFLNFTAQASRYKDVDSLKVAISSDLENFWAAYRKWETKNHPKEKLRQAEKEEAERKLQRIGADGVPAGKLAEPGVEGAEATPEPHLPPPPDQEDESPHQDNKANPVGGSEDPPLPPEPPKRSTVVHPSPKAKGKDEPIGFSKGPRIEPGKKPADYLMDGNMVKCPPGGEREGLLTNKKGYCDALCRLRKRCFLFVE